MIFLNRQVLLACILLSLFALFALLAPLFSPYTGVEVHLLDKNKPPSWQFLLGTDELGRDLCTRVALGIRISLFIGLIASLIDLIVGVFFATLSVFFSKRWRSFLLQTMDILYAIPHLLLVILLSTSMGPGYLSLLIALTMTGWIRMARILRSHFLDVKERAFVQASLAMGANKRHILWVHLLPNSQGPLLVTLTLTISSTIFAEAFLSFLGLGIQAPYASLGTMTSEALSALPSYPWRLFVPGGSIILILLAFSMLSDALRDIFSLGYAE